MGCWHPMRFCCGIDLTSCLALIWIYINHMYSKIWTWPKSFKHTNIELEACKLRLKNQYSNTCIYFILTQNSNLGPGEEGGCPFKHFDETNLKRFMCQAGIGSTQQELITRHVKQQSYSSACAAFFHAQLHAWRSCPCTSGVPSTKEEKFLVSGSDKSHEHKEYTDKHCVDKHCECTDSGCLPVCSSTQKNSLCKPVNGADGIKENTEANLSYLKLIKHGTAAENCHSSVLGCESRNSVGQVPCLLTAEADIVSSQITENSQQSCYNHTVCPSSQGLSSTDSVTRLSEHQEQVLFHKPVDYYASFDKLMRGLTVK